jgi:uncharacterized protein
MIAVDSIAFIRADLVTFGAAVGAFIVLILFVAFRQPRWVLCRSSPAPPPWSR